MANGIVLGNDILILNRHIKTAKGRHKRTELHMAVVKTCFHEIFFHLYLIFRLLFVV